MTQEPNIFCRQGGEQNQTSMHDLTCFSTAHTVLREHSSTGQCSLCTVYIHIPLVSLLDEVLECCVSVRAIQGVLKDMPCSCAKVRSCANVIWPGNDTPGHKGCCSVWWGTATPDTNDAVGEIESASKRNTRLNMKIYIFVACNESCIT